MGYARYLAAPFSCSLSVAAASAVLVLIAWLAPVDAAFAHKSHQPVRAQDAHAGHISQSGESGYTRSVQFYDIPDVSLVRMDGSETSLASVLSTHRPVFLNFIFTSCSTICPLLSAIFSQTQHVLGPEVEEIQMISISIDPEHDTPRRLAEYAGRFRAGAQWIFLTGNLEDIIAVQKAFGAYRGSKMSHAPLTFLRAADATAWVRLEGFASAADLIQEYRQIRSE